MSVDLMALAEGNDEPKLSRGLSDLRGNAISKDLLSKFNASTPTDNYEAIPKPKSPARKWTPPTSPIAVATGGAKPPSSPTIAALPAGAVISSATKVEEPMSPQSPLSANPFMQKDRSHSSMSAEAAPIDAGCKVPTVGEELEGAAERIRAARKSFAEAEKSPTKEKAERAGSRSSSTSQPAEEETEEAGVAARVRAARNSFSQLEKQVEQDKQAEQAVHKAPKERTTEPAVPVPAVKLDEVDLADPTAEPASSTSDAVTAPVTAAAAQALPTSSVEPGAASDLQVKAEAEVQPKVEVDATPSSTSGAADAAQPAQPPAEMPKAGSCCIIA